jgi:hypothetical protein
MSPEVINRILQRARSDPEFFHKLVFTPEKVFREIPELSRGDKAAMLAAKPEEFFVAGLAVAAQCGDTCGDRSCSRTCGWASCSDTCSKDSCGRTCKSSCRVTVALQFERGAKRRGKTAARSSRSKSRA